VSGEASSVVIDGLVKRYGSVTAVDRVSLTVGAGKTVVLLGESGCGKTSILRCVAGLEDVDGGTIRIGDELVADGRRQVPAESRRIGMVFQDYALWPHMTAVRNVAFAAQRKSVGRAARDRAGTQARELLATVGLHGLYDRLPSQLSGGQQQRVAVARAIAGDVRVLLMDEPLSALDQSQREDLRLELRGHIQRSGLACLYVTHDQQEALAMADELVVMQRGHFMERGDPTECYERPHTAFGAEFLGARNVVTGTVVESGAQGHVARVEGQDVVFTAPSGPIAVGTSVELRWRPSDILVGESASGTSTGVNRWPGRVVREVYLGGVYELALDGLGVQLRARCPYRVPVGDGTFSIAPDRVLGYARTGDTAVEEPAALAELNA
jgi:ABC-type Fe3+/spermidine/putrescine transport system ATPase subunit